jgi:hypothetical protein
MLQPEYQFPEKSQPISARFGAHGVWDSTGIDFSSYARMQTTTRKSVTFWRTGIPSFVMHHEKLREVIVCITEIRSGIYKPQQGTHAERLARAQERITAKRPAQIAMLDSLCELYVAARSIGAPTAVLESQIEKHDTQLRMSENEAAFVASIIYLSYHARMNSSQVGNILGLKGMHVRQLLWRACRIAASLDRGEIPKAQHPLRKYTNAERQKAYRQRRARRENDVTCP